MSPISPHAVSPDDLPVEFGRYQLTQLLGEGGMGRVFGGYLRGPAGFRKEVALKVIRREGHDDNDQYRESFLREARIMGLLRHPNLVDCYDFGFQDDHPYIAMERIEGASLRALIRKLGRLPVTVALDLGLQLCAGLSHAHGMQLADREGGVIHRDLKPENLIVTELGAVKVLDFGLALDGEEATEESRPTDSPEQFGIEGTPGYLSPEQARGHPLDARSDLFAVGLILFEAITGERFFEGKDILPLIFAAAHLSDPSRRLAKADTYLPGAASVLSRCLRPAPAERFARMSLLHGALENLLHSLPPGPNLRSLMAGSGNLVAQETASTEAWALEAVPTVTHDGLGNDFDVASGPGPSGSRASAIFARQTNLPPEAEVFIGRGDVLHSLVEMVRPGKITTLVGTGGAGKTRLAIHFGIQELKRWAVLGGVWFCDLCEARTKEDFLVAVAGVLDVSLSDLDESDGPEGAQLRLGWALAGRGPVLLILDNFEQLEASTGTVLDSWLDMAPQLNLLVTSRRALRSSKEQVLHLDPLSTEDAVHLFEERAALVRPGFALNESAVPTVREIVTRLDCLPLAVELAAARAGLLSPEQILGRLSERFRLLSSRQGGRTTLEGTIGWSWDLLDVQEQEALWQCTAFRGSFRIEAAEEVLDLRHYENSLWVLDILDALREKSLLTVRRRRDRPDEVRFALLESIREFAIQKGESFSSSADLGARHATAVLNHAEECLERWNVYGDIDALEDLRLEEGNLLAVIDQRLAHSPSESGRAAIAASAFLEHSRSTAEIVNLLKRCIDRCRSSGEDEATLGQLLAVLPRLLPVKESLTALEEAVEITTRLGDSRASCLTLCAATHLALKWNDFDKAASFVERATALGELLSDPTLTPHTTRSQAEVAYYTDPKAASALHRKALSEWEALGHWPEACRELNYLAILEIQAGNVERGAALFRRALAGFRKVGLKRKAVMLAGNVGLIEAQLGEFDAAREHLTTACSEATEIGSRYLYSMSVVSLIELEITQGRYAAAEALSDDVSTLLGTQLPPEGTTNILVSQANLMRALGRIRESVTLAQEAFEFCESHNVADFRAMSRLVLAACLGRAGRGDEASEYTQWVLDDTRAGEDTGLTEALNITQETLELYRAAALAENDPAALQKITESARKTYMEWNESRANGLALGTQTLGALFLADVERIERSVLGP